MPQRDRVAQPDLRPAIAQRDRVGKPEPLTAPREQDAARTRPDRPSTRDRDPRLATGPSPRLLALASDAHLVAMIRQGRGGAFEAVYRRHHRPILGLCRHLLRDWEDAEDALQHTFLAAYNDIVSTDKQVNLRAWLFRIARNRCYSMLRARREQAADEQLEVASEGIVTHVQRREDLRELIVDLRDLPDDQRRALILAELDSLTHEEIGAELGVPREKVKALVFQARSSLMASRAARETDCAQIRQQLATLRGAGLRRANLRRHLHRCAGCRGFRSDLERRRAGRLQNAPVRA
jgi:RNA polymerase sigma factor (sigma-70 family)